MKRPRSDVAVQRREQIVEAAVAVIAEQGFDKLSLSEIEDRAGMCRGQLTYYFPTKEAILLAVFDRTLRLMYERIGTPRGQACEEAGVWEWVRHLLGTVATQPRACPEFDCLQYTFLAQMGPRADFRRRLASLYAEWRGNMAGGFQDEFTRQPPARAVRPQALATLIQALLHGLAMQSAADPDAFDPQEMRQLCLDMVATYLSSTPWQPEAKKQAAARKKRAGSAKVGNGRIRKRDARVTNGRGDSQ